MDHELDAEAPTEHLAVLGSPIAHSKSPAIHRAAYRELGLAWSYGRHELQADELEAFLRAHHRGWRGFSLTMPLKEEAHRLAAILDPIAEATGVVNTLLRLDSERQPWAGFNTDVGGLAAAIAHAELNTRHTVILGAGATAVSAVLAAKQQGADRITVAARRPEAAAALADRFEIEASDLSVRSQQQLAVTATAIISTLPGPAGDSLEVAAELFTVPLFDVAYDPWPSPLAAQWTSRGGTAHSGDAMLIEQARLQLRVFVAGDPGMSIPGEDRAVAQMREAMARATGMGG